MQQLSKLRKIGPPARQVKLRSIQARASIDVGGIEKKANEFSMEFTPVGTKLLAAYDEKVTGVVLEGGSRSSKTHSIIQFLIKYAQDHEFSIEDRRVLIARQKATWTAATVLYDFINVLKFYKLFDHCHYNKTSKILRLYQTDFYFGGLDDAQKLHGFQSDIFWINEAIEAQKDDFDQLEQRLKGFFILDYNPSAEEHWIYDSVINRKDVRYIHSTMLDNPFIAERSRLKILSYDPGNPENVISGTADKNKWEIYGLGLRSKIEGIIFTNWQLIQEIPEHAKRMRHRYGLDWGYSNDPTAIIDVYFSGNDVWLDELCYELEMKYPEIADVIKDNGLKGIKGYADPADPRGIREVYDRGCNIHEAAKPAGSVNAGINILKECRIFVTERSVNLIKEFKNYKWKQDKSGKYLNEPLDDFNHLIDSARYVIFMEKRPAKRGQSKKTKDTVGGII